MTEQRVDKLEVAMTTLTDKFSEFIAIESGRQERDKNQVTINERVLKHMEKVDADYRPILTRSKKYQDWIDAFVGKIILPAIALAVLAAAGYSFT
jgi:hypothetical protein